MNQLQINENLSKTFDFLRFPLAILVILLHIQPTVRIFDFDRLIFENPADKLYLAVNMIGSKLAMCAVPTFFCISGYLLVFNINRLHLSVYLSKIKNRIKTLFIPFLVWNILAVVYLLATKQIDWNRVTFLYTFIGPANFPLWFLRDLITLVAIFPLFYFLAKYGGRLTFIAISFFFIAGCPYFFYTNLYFLYINSIYFFYAGIFTGVNKLHLDKVAPIIKIVIASLFIGLLITSCIFRGYYAHYLSNLYLIFGVGTIFILGHWCVAHLKLTAVGTLSSASFFVYCSHKLGPTYISKLGFSYLNIETDLVIFLFSPILSALLCIGIYWVLKYYFPKVLGILTGRI